MSNSKTKSTRIRPTCNCSLKTPLTDAGCPGCGECASQPQPKRRMRRAVSRSAVPASWLAAAWSPCSRISPSTRTSDRPIAAAISATARIDALIEAGFAL